MKKAFLLLLILTMGVFASDSLDAGKEQLTTTFLDPANGYISFWMQAPWEGNDGKQHAIMAIGTSENGFCLVKSAKNMLRLSNFSADGERVARADVSSWKKGEWHHIAFAWYSNKEGMPIGLPLYIDTICEDGPVPNKNSFFDQEGDNPPIFAKNVTFSDIKYFNGAWSGNQADAYNLFSMVFKDFFKGLPAEEIRITSKMCGVDANPLVVEGKEKTFALEAKFNGNWIRVTDEMRRYGNWSDFDAKPYIKWTVQDQEIAEVKKLSNVLGKKPGKTSLTAEYRGQLAKYDLEVTPIDQPDLCVLYTSVLPRLSSNSVKWFHAPGDTVTSIVHVANYGYKDSTAGTVVTFTLYKNPGLDFDPKAEVLYQKKAKVPALQGMGKAEFQFVWQWPEEAVWMESKVEADKEGDLDPMNNIIRDRNVSRPLRFGFQPDTMTNLYTERTINSLGSFNLFDWTSSHKYRLDLLLRETKYPGICPDGITDTYRIDRMYYIYKEKNEKQPYYQVEEWFDGGFPIYTHDLSLDGISAAVVHELGHTCLALPDVYSYPVRTVNVLVRDDNGCFYARTPAMPDIGGSIMNALGINVPCGAMYSPLMDGCHMWINPSNAGKIEYMKGQRGERFWGVQGRMMPIKQNIFQFFDRNDEPLKDAAVYIYQITNTKTASFADKYYSDWPKFAGNTNEEGSFTVGGETLDSWDCPTTDRTERRTSVWNPFGMISEESNATVDTAFTPNVWTTEGLLLIKIVASSGVEFCNVSMAIFNEEFFRGNKIRGTYKIRTNLINSERQSVKTKELPEACREKNLKPIAKLKGGKTEFSVKKGQEITLDAGESSDPEGQPLEYRWHDGGNWYSTDLRTGPVQIYKAPDKAGETKKIDLFVIDGIRTSDLVNITITATE